MVSFALTICIVLIGGLLGYFNIRQLEENDRQLASAYAFIARLDSLLSSLKDAETGQRGYLLTQKKEYLEPYQAALAKIQSTLRDLKERASGKPEQQAHLADLEGKITERVEELRRTIALVDAGDRPAAMKIVQSDIGRTMMADLRAAIAAIQDAETSRLNGFADQSRISALAARLSQVLVTLVGVVLVCAVYYLSQKSLQDRKQAADAAAAQRELLRVTLTSIGDAVITTDIQARITFLNDAARAVTGWADDAIGQPLENVFRLIDEHTRLPMDNPARRALSSGGVVGLIGHGVLLRKDGSECFVDDSTAPIKDGDGNAVGCVVIFRDISERRLLEHENASQLSAARLLAAIVESSLDAIVSKSLDGTIQSWNLAAQRLFGYSAQEAVGKNITLIIPADRTQEEEQIIRRIRAGERVDHFDTVRMRKDGQPIHVSLTISPIPDEQGHIVGASKIARDITDHKEAEERIYGLLADLKAADCRKDEFLAILAHELRGPLTPLRNCLEILKRGGDAAAMADACATMERQLGIMVRLVDDLLDVSRITRNKIELRREIVDLSSILEESVDACRPLIASKNLALSVALPSQPIALHADAVRLVQVFTNILNNACKYTGSGGRIWLAAESQDGRAVVTIRDNGMGIPVQKLASVFDMFSQLERTLEHSQGGLGIGLTLVKRLVEMHGGSVEAHSRGPGTGSEFVVRLPIMLSPARATEPTQPEPATVSSARVLIVDDNADAARSLAMLLKIAGNETHLAHDGLAAIDAAESLHPDLILLDIGLPKLNGLDTCRRIRQQPWGKHTVIVALTGWGQEADRQQSRQAGFDHHLVKPVKYEDLMSVLAASLAPPARQTDA
ncbi:MAG TPA: PAS domain S-box protein [Gemmataceae bacterium]|nr:PAS domain S-box protein [Gemmataceae bacterium]